MQFTKIYKSEHYYRLLNGEKLGRNQKELKKSIVGKFAGSFVGSAKFCNPYKIGKVATASPASTFAFFYAL